MSLRVIKLHFNQPVHFGKKRLGESAVTMESDTLFSALFIEALKLKMDTSFLLSDLLISDTFPFSNQTLFLPKPMKHVSSEVQDVANKKVFKKLKYIPIEAFETFLKGQCSSVEVQKFVELLDLGNSEVQTKVALESMEAKQLGESQPYNVGLFRFNTNAGLYFVAQGTDETLHKLEFVLESLQYSGIGGKRTSGCGQFSFEMTTHVNLQYMVKKHGTNKILLSTAMANENENLDQILENASYLLKKRSGFVQSTTYASQLVKKQDYYSFAAGSVFQHAFNGEIVDVGNNGNHPVYRYAKALWLEVEL